MSLADKDRIFTNLYGFKPWGITHAISRAQASTRGKGGDDGVWH